MLRRYRSVLLLAAAGLLLVPTISSARSQLISVKYPTAKRAARCAAAFAMNRNSGLRQSMGVIKARRLVTKGNPSLTPSGKMARYKVVTRKKVKGTSKPLAEMLVTVRKTKAGWRAYVPGRSRLKINKKGSGSSISVPGGEMYVGREDWIEVYGAEGEHWPAPNGGVYVPRW